MLSFNGLILKKILAIVLFIILASRQTAKCQESILDSAFTFSTGQITTINALNIISRETGYNFTYDSRLIDPERNTELTFTGIKLNVILDSILQNDSLVFSVIDKYIIIAKAVPIPEQQTDTLQEPDIIYISGIIVDKTTGDPLPFATIGLKNSGRGTITNSNGEFGLKITPDSFNDTLSFSYLGFLGKEIPVNQFQGKNLSVKMSREFIPIPEIIIRTQVPQEIIYKTISAISDNYGNSPAMLTGFYREGVMKKNDLQVYSEALLQIFKSSYSGTILGDQIKVYKSRKIENLGLDDTLALRLKAGLKTCLELDLVKNSFEFMEKSSMAEYSYRITDIVTYDDEAVWVIDFEQRKEIDKPLFRGSIFINTDDFAILNADFELHPKYLQKLKDSFILSSSRRYTTWPVSVKYSVSYRKINNRYFLNHVRGDLVFVSKQKKKLFNSQFKVFLELAITSVNTVNVARFEREELAPVHSVFSKTIKNYDQDFWGNQDFLKPEDNLLKALKNMNVKLQEFSEEPVE
jgi:hypothetical protein